MKVIFLDIDGVLINMRYASRNTADPLCVDILNKITDRTGAKIVVSSSWKHYGLPKITLILKQWGVTGDIIGITPNSGMAQRIYDIGEWLADYYDETGSSPESIVIIDDEKDACIGFAVWCVLVSDINGLTYSDQERAIAILENRLRD